MKKIVLAMVGGMLLVGPVLAQTIQLGPTQQRNTRQATTSWSEKGPDGKPLQKSVTENINLPIERTNATGEYHYSGIPGKWMRGSRARGGQESGAGGQVSR